MKRLWSRLMLSNYATPQDNGHIPWYGWIFAAAFVVGWLSVDRILSTVF